jgi:hypothetical protein
MMDLIVQEAKAREERYRGQTEGTERREANRMMLKMIRVDKSVLRHGNDQESVAQYDTGMTV